MNEWMPQLTAGLDVHGRPTYFEWKSKCATSGRFVRADDVSHEVVFVSNAGLMVTFSKVLFHSPTFSQHFDNTVLPDLHTLLREDRLARAGVI